MVSGIVSIRVDGWEAWRLLAQVLMIELIELTGSSMVHWSTLWRRLTIPVILLRWWLVHSAKHSIICKDQY